MNTYKMNSSLYSLALCAALISVIAASSVTSSSYTTSDDASSRRTLFISTFEFTGEQPRGTLYAVVGDKSLIAAKNPETKSFQVSWSEEHKLAGAGTYTVQLYSEEGHAALRKAKRDGQSAEDVKPLATLSIDHNGVYQGPWLSSETVASIAAVVLMYFAYTKKCSILA